MRKKQATRLQITRAGRERLARKQSQTSDGGLTDAVNWAKMAEAGKGQAYTPEQEAARKLMIATEKKNAYQAGLGVNMQKRSAYGKKWKARAASDNKIVRDRGKENITYNENTGTKHNAGPKSRGSLWNQVTDTVFGDGDKYDGAGNRRTSGEQRMERLKRKTAADKAAARKRAKQAKNARDAGI